MPYPQVWRAYNRNERASVRLAEPAATANHGHDLHAGLDFQHILNV